MRNRFLRSFAVAMFAFGFICLVGWLMSERRRRSAEAVYNDGAEMEHVVVATAGRVPAGYVDASIPHDGAFARQVADGISISVVTQIGQPVPSVEVWESVGNLAGPVRIGTTDSLGVFSCPISGSHRQLRFSHPDYLTATLSLDSRSRDAQLLVLDRPATILGNVVSLRTGQAVSDVWVLAFRDGHPPSKRDVYAALQSGKRPEHVGFSCVRADEFGNFELGQLQPGVPYTLAAGGGGCVAPTRISGVYAADPSVRVAVDDLFGITIRYRDANTSARIEQAAYLWEHPGPMWTAPSSIFEGIPTDTLEAILAGLDLEQTTRQAGPEFVVIGTAPKGMEEPGPIEFTGKMVGYGAIHMPLRLRPFRKRPPVHEIELEPKLGPRSHVRVHLSGRMRNGASAIEGRVYDIGFVRFRSIDGNSIPDMRWPVRALDSEPIVIREVPCGTYEVLLSMPSGHRRVDPAEGAQVLVSENGLDLHFDLGSLCTAQIVVSSAQEGEFSGEVVVRVLTESGGRQSTKHIVFKGPPYYIDGLLPGRCGFKLERPFDSGPTRFHDLNSEQDEQGLVSIVFVE